MGFEPRWYLRQSERFPGFWVGRPNVPGGVMRVMIQDDFGNLVDLPMTPWAVTAANCWH